MGGAFIFSDATLGEITRLLSCTLFSYSPLLLHLGGVVGLELSFPEVLLSLEDGLRSISGNFVQFGERAAFSDCRMQPRRFWSDSSPVSVAI